MISYRIDDGPYHTLQNSSFSQKIFVSEDVGGSLTTHRASLAPGQVFSAGKLSVTNNSVAPDGLSASVTIGIGNPTLLSIADNVSGGPITVGQSVNYTVTFDEAIKASTIGTDDFENGFTAVITVDSVTATANPAVFAVSVTPTAAGLLRLQIKAGAVIADLDGSVLNTASALPDDTTISVKSSSAPILLAITDNVAGKGANNSGAIKRRRQVLDHSIEQLLDALILKGRAAEHRHKFAFEGRLAQATLKLINATPID
jgi:hypothetical protein